MKNKVWGQSWGYQYSFDGSGCNEKLCSYDTIYEFYTELLNSYQLLPIGFPNVIRYPVNDNSSFFASQMLMTGCINLYLYPKDGMVYIDMLVDHVFNPDLISVLCTKHFGTQVYKSNFLRRQAYMEKTGKNEDDILTSILLADNVSFEQIFTKANPEGHYLEFGVFEGKSIKEMAAAAPDKKIYGFDSFDGLPEDWKDGDMVKGAFKCDIPKDLPSNVELVVGLFQDTLEDWAKNNPGPISVIHLDADLYSSTDYVMKTLEDRFVDGTIIVFDEIWGHPDHANHEYKNFVEFLERTNFKWECLGNRHGEASAFKIYK